MTVTSTMKTAEFIQCTVGIARPNTAGFRQPVPTLDAAPGASEPEIFLDVLYGQLMHGDYEKWYLSNARPGTGWDVNAVAMVLSQVEQLVLGTRTAIVEGLERGYLQLGESA
jgi:hypothetical protein